MGKSTREPGSRDRCKIQTKPCVYLVLGLSRATLIGAAGDSSWVMALGPHFLSNQSSSLLPPVSQVRLLGKTLFQRRILAMQNPWPEWTILSTVTYSVRILVSLHLIRKKVTLWASLTITATIHGTPWRTSGSILGVIFIILFTFHKPNAV